MLALLALLGCGPHLPSEEELVAEALPAVVLLVNDRLDGTTTWGSGLAVQADGLVLTNLHVVDEAESLRLLRYQEGRATYTPMDGGLERFLFENEPELLPGVMVRSDKGLDLAVVKVEVEEPLQVLPVRTEPLVQGERVYALGHPQETVWSFTSGMVSALPSGAIQHDAPINAGNSGGPLLDARGRVAGINTAKMLGQAEGVAFARPMDLAIRVVDEAAEGLVLDRSTPEKAARACLGTLETGSLSVLDCTDWEHRWLIVQEEVEAVERMKLFEPGRARTFVDEAGGRAFWIARMQEVAMAGLRPERKEAWRYAELRHPVPEAALRRHGLEPEAFRARQRQLLATLMATTEAENQRWIDEHDLRIDRQELSNVSELLRGGVRVEEVRPWPDDPDKVWIHFAGRNPDSSVYRWTDLYVHLEDGWTERAPVVAADAARLPEGWPPVGTPDEAFRAALDYQLVTWVAWSGATEEERQAARELPRPERPLVEPHEVEG